LKVKSTACYILAEYLADRGIRISSFSAAVYSEHEQSGKFNERVDGEKGREGEGGNTDRDGGQWLKCQKLLSPVKKMLKIIFDFTDSAR